MIRNCYPSFVSRSSSPPFSLLVLYRSGRCAVATYTANTCNIVMRRLKYLNPCLCSSLWYSFSFLFLLFLGSSFFTDTEKFVDGGKCQMYHCLYTDIHWPNNVRHPISLFSFFFIFLFFHCFFATPATNYTARRPICLSDERRESSPSFDCISVALIKKTKRWPDYRSVLYRISLSLSLSFIFLLPALQTVDPRPLSVHLSATRWWR